MKILDFYIIRKFIFTLLFLLLAFTCIFIVIHLIDNLRNFLNNQVPQVVILKYYLYYIPFITVLILPICILLAALFSIGNLAHYNEIIAMKSAGQSLIRILMPLFILAFLISIFMIFFSEKIVPFTNQKMFNIERELLGKHQSLTHERSNIYFRDPQFENWIYINHYDPRLKRAHRVSIQKVQHDKVSYRIDAQRMTWENDHWVLTNGCERTWNSKGHFEYTYFPSRNFTQLSLLPDDFNKVQKRHEEMTYQELQEFIREVAQNGGEPKTWLVDLYLKISFPFSSFIIMLFGAPLAANKTRSGKALGFGLSLFVSFFFFGFVKTGQALGHSGVLHPLLAAWLGNIVFLVAGLIIIARIK